MILLLPLAIICAVGMLVTWLEKEERKAGVEAQSDIQAGFSWEDYGALPRGYTQATRDLERDTARIILARQAQRR